MIIAIDGPAGTGKTTLSKALANALGFAYFETGAMYRAFTWYVQQHNVDYEDPKALEKALSEFHYTLTPTDEGNLYFVNGQNVTQDLRSEKITQAVSRIAAIEKVRAHLVPIQKLFGESHDAVFEGRDMGSVVFPKARVKIYLTASAKVRAQRRFDELQKKGSKQTYNEVLKEIQERDHSDETRAHSPLKKAHDAILIDSSNMTIDQVKKRLIRIANDAMNEKIKFFYRSVCSFVRLLMRLFYRHRVIGIEHLPSGKAVIAPNHVSFLDPPIIGISSPFPVHFFARSTLFDGKILGPIITRLNSHPIEYGDQELKAIKIACRLLKDEKKVVLFPEGERSVDGELGEFKGGAVRIAAREHAPIIPTYIGGAYDVWPRIRSKPKLKGQTLCVFGKPIYPKDYSHLPKKEGLEKLNADLKSAIAKLAKEHAAS
jgi:cytidylate kinase